jgi:glycosyltransferase involved in cell wall biosynthesis
MVLLSLLRWMVQQRPDIEPTLLLPLPGPLAEVLAGLAPVVRTPAEADASRYDLVYANTITSHRVLQQYALTLNCPLLTHVHELDGEIRRVGQPCHYPDAPRQSFIAASQPVVDNLIRRHGVAAADITLCPEFLDAEDVVRRAWVPAVARAALGISPGVQVIGGCGSSAPRKGADLFVEVAKVTELLRPSTTRRYVWIGCSRHEIDWANVPDNVANRIAFFPATPAASSLFTAFDTFLLTSREDPMPLVVLESALLGRPIAAFDVGGASSFLAGAGRVVPALDVEALARANLELLEQPDVARQLSVRAFARVWRRHDVAHGAPLVLRQIAKLIGTDA